MNNYRKSMIAKLKKGQVRGILKSKNETNVPDRKKYCPRCSNKRKLNFHDQNTVSYHPSDNEENKNTSQRNIRKRKKNAKRSNKSIALPSKTSMEYTEPISYQPSVERNPLVLNRKSLHHIKRRSTSPRVNPK